MRSLRLAPALLRFVWHGAHLAVRHRAALWKARGNRLSAVALEHRTAARSVRGGPLDEEKAASETALALVYWRASDSLQALGDALFGRQGVDGK